jgi:hypothetical protein
MTEHIPGPSPSPSPRHGPATTSPAPPPIWPRTWSSTAPVATVGARANLEGLTPFAQRTTGMRIIAALDDYDQALIMYEVTIGPSVTVTCAQHLTIRDGKIQADRLTFDAAAARAAQTPRRQPTSHPAPPDAFLVLQPQGEDRVMSLARGAASPLGWIATVRQHCGPAVPAVVTFNRPASQMEATT